MENDYDPTEFNSEDDANIEEVVENAIDYTESFTTTTVFPSRKDLIDWVIEVGKMFNIVIIISRSNGGEGQGFGNAKATLTCERRGRYRLSKPGKPADVEKFTGTKKIMCPFRLQAKEHVGGGWSVYVLHGMHNHRLPDYNEGRAIIGKMTEQELSLVQELTKSHVLPNKIMDILRNVNEKTLTTVKHVYNARHKIKKQAMEGRSVMQQLMKLIVDNGYMQWHREEVGTDVVRDIVFAHPNVVDLLKLFHYVLIIDCTYKTNKYKMPFLEIVGMVSTGKNFAIGFAWLKDEQKESYEWALRCIRDLFDDDKLPGAIVTDREKALMNAVSKVFPDSSQLLCTRHIQKNVENYMGKLTKNRSIIKAFVNRWHRVVEANSVTTFNTRVEEVSRAFRKMPAILRYVQANWIKPYGSRFLRSHTMDVLHFGTRTTNRVESAHAALKSWLRTSTGSLDTIWPKIHSYLESQIREIKATFQRSQNKDPHVTVLRLFMLLKGKISHKALRLLDKEYNRKDIREDEVSCGCYLRYTHGLPSSHEMRKMEVEGRSIQLSDIHIFWRTLKVKGSLTHDTTSERFPFEFQHDIDKVLHSFFVDIMALLEERKKLIATQIEKMICPEFTTLKEPVVNDNCRGRPPTSKNSTKRNPSAWEYTEKECSKYFKGLDGRRSPSVASVRSRGQPPTSVSICGSEQASTCAIRGRGCGKGKIHVESSNNISLKNAQRIPSHIRPYVGDLPTFILPFISNINNVNGDGNCGYRVVARWMYDDENLWPTVRQELAVEIERRFDLYSDALGSLDNALVALNSLDHFVGLAPKSKWMSLLDMGMIIATRYNVVVVSYSTHQSMTFFPVVAAAGKKSPDRIITLAFLASMEHFIMVEMNENFPLPTIHPYWHHHHHTSVDGWEIPFHSRLQHWREISSHPVQQNDADFLIID